MEIIRGKAEMKKWTEAVLATYQSGRPEVFVNVLHSYVLNKKAGFPILEYCARELFAFIPADEQLSILDRIVALKTIGGNVLAGILLQLRQPAYFAESNAKASEYIIYGNEWYVCDIIGERVFGNALLKYPEETIPVLRKLSSDPDKWMVRSVGVACHYAVKKGLKKEYVKEMFDLLLSLSNTTEFHTKKGIGWAAKTVAKFHPELVAPFLEKIQSDQEIKQWFRTKIRIGLGRSFKYASRHTG